MAVEQSSIQEQVSVQQQLDNLRKRIDSLDEQIQKLICQRAQCVLEVAHVKHRSGGKIEYYRPEREAQLLRRIKNRNQGPLSDSAIMRLFREIISAGMVLEQELTIAFAQSLHALQAVYQHFGQSVHNLPLANTEAVFESVNSGNAHFGIVATDQRIAELFLRYSLQVCGELYIDDRLAPFLVIGKQTIAPSGDDKTMLLIVDSEGVKPRLLRLDGHRNDPATERQIKHWQENANLCRCLGSYPSSVS